MPTYHVDNTTGVDTGSRSGLSLAQAWKTVGYAVAGKSPGDIVWAHAGNYSISVQIAIPQGVSLEGDGKASTIFNCILAGSESWSNTSFAFLLSGGTNSSGQHISNIGFNGNAYTGYGSIAVWNRKNVQVSFCDFVKFSHWGVRFYEGEPPATDADYITGCRFFGNTMNDCAGWNDGSLGCLGIGGVDGMLIYNNTIVQPANRGVTNEGEPIFGVEGFIKNVKIYNNTLTKVNILAGRWDFAIEIWNWEGGNEIYNNVITGSIDIVGATTKGSSTYSVWVHDNIISQPALVNKQSIRGILLEGLNTDVLIERNYIHHVTQGIYIQTANWLDPPNTIYRLTQTNITIRYNIFDNIGSLAASSGWGLYISQEDGDDPFTNFRFHNNVIIGSTNAQWGISVPDCSISSNQVYIENNIIQGFAYAPVRMNDWSSGNTTVTNLSIQNNIFYNNGNSNNPSFAAGASYLTGYVNSGNLKTQPPFISSSNYHLTSSRIGVFVANGLTDKDGNTVANPPTIGAFEYGSVPANIPVTAVIVTGTSGSITITVDKGTLQMYAHIDPHNATNQNVIWSVVNGTGQATISSTGLLTAVKNGTVIVSAKSIG